MTRRSIFDWSEVTSNRDEPLRSHKVPTGKKSAGGHEKAVVGGTNEWLTPPGIITALGPFDLDPCSPISRPWPTATNHFTILDDGLHKQWLGRVWMNPPYGPEMGDWLKKLALHGNGIALVFARTDTVMFQRWGLARAHAILFVSGRIHFYTISGKRAKGNAGAPSALIAYGDNNVTALKNSKIPGKVVLL